MPGWVQTGNTLRNKTVRHRQAKATQCWIVFENTYFTFFFQIKKHVFYGFYGNDVSKSRSESAIVLLSVISCEPQNFHAPFFRDFRGQVSKRENKGAQILCAHYGDYYHRQYHGRYQVLKTQNLRAANMYPRKKPQYKKARENLGVFSISPSKWVDILHSEWSQLPANFFSPNVLYSLTGVQ